MSDVSRFLDKITIGDGCWEWQAHCRDGGYGVFRWNGRAGMAYRYAYELMVGPIPAGYHVDHLCRNGRCVRFDHLEAVTASENSRRRRGTVKPKDACPRGHLYDDVNTGMDGGYRYCRECNRIACKSYYEKRMALGVGRLTDGPVTHCKHGHEFTSENTYVKPPGRRQCRTCARQRRATSKRLKREAAE
jgi:hypothetical protein